jgi:hypothetical protein
MYDENSFMVSFLELDNIVAISIKLINLCSCTEKFLVLVSRHMISYAPRLVFYSETNSELIMPEEFHHRDFV